MREEGEQQPATTQEEEKMQQLRSKATELLLREEYQESIQAYTQFISLSETQISNPHLNPAHRSKLHRSLCLAFSNRAEARSKLRDFDSALQDCERALQICDTHFKTLVCKGKILLGLNRYNPALNCFKAAVLDPQANSDSETLHGYLEKCKKLELLSRSGGFDFSSWILNGFKGKLPELPEFIGSVDIKKSEISGRGLVATRNIDAGSVLVVTKAVATERGILPESSKREDLGENAQLVMWKSLIDKVVYSASKCQRTHVLISKLSAGENEEVLEVPDISLFKPEAEENWLLYDKVDNAKMVSILDVNSLVEETFSAKVLGKSGDYHGVGIWLLASFINHSCNPNAKRFHIGDHIIIHASRDVKAGEEITLGYFDVFLPMSNRKEMTKNWGFICHCKRCKFEEGICVREEMREIEVGFERGFDIGTFIYKLEESMRRWMVRGKGKGYLRASYWGAYSEVFGSEKLMRRWGRRIPAMEVVVESVMEAVGGDQRVLKVFMEGMKRSTGSGVVEMEKAMKLGRGVYGKVMKKQAMRSLLELGLHEQS